MNYILIALDMGKLKVTTHRNKLEVMTYIVSHYQHILSDYASKNTNISDALQLIEIEPNFEFMSIGIQKPVRLEVTIG